MTETTIVIADEMREVFYNQLIVQIVKMKRRRVSVALEGDSAHSKKVRLDHDIAQANEFRIVMDMTSCKITLTKSDLITVYNILGLDDA